MSTELRGTGRTTRLLKATPDGGVFITHSADMRKYIEYWFEEDGREKGSVKVISARQALDQLRGVSAPITIDHAITDRLCNFITREEEDFLAEYCAYRAPFVIRCDDQGEVRVIWNDHRR